MPYKNNSELPDSVKNHLPKHALDIYREAFNHAYLQYQDQVNDKYAHEQIAHKVAWSAVKKKYEKNEYTNTWQEKS